MHPTNLFISYASDIQRVFAHLEDIDLARISDPMGISGYISPCKSKVYRASAKSKVTTALSRATKACKAERTRQYQGGIHLVAHAIWWQISKLLQMSIQEKQNCPESLTKLAAQRQLYHRAKRARNLGFFLVGLVGILVIAVFVTKNETFSQFVALVAMFTWFLDQIVLKPWESALKKEAATIQEEFDCFVLDLAVAGT